jgi:chromosome segregation ATPase
MPPKSQVEKIIADLQALAEALGDASSLSELTARAKADYESCQKALKQIKTEVQEAKSGLSQAQSAAEARFKQDMFTKQGELRDLTQRVEAVRTELQKLTIEFNTKTAQLTGINAAVDDVKRRLS